MHQESALTPLLLQAFNIYRNTYGLIPPIFAEININNKHQVILKMHSRKRDKLKTIYSFLVVTLEGLLFTGISILILKKFFTPNKTNLSILEFAILVVFFTLCGVVFGSLYLYNKSRFLLPQITLFIQEGLGLRMSFCEI